MRVRERSKDALDDVPGRAIGQADAVPRAEPKQANQRDPLDVLEDQRGEPVLLDERTHLDDRRMVQAHAQRRLARERLAKASSCDGLPLVGERS